MVAGMIRGLNGARFGCSRCTGTGDAVQAYARQIISATALPFLDMRTAGVAHLRIVCTEHSLLAIAVQDLAWTDTLDCLTGTIAAFAKCT